MKIAVGVLSVALLTTTAACGPGSSKKEAKNDEAVSTDISKGNYKLKLWDGAGLKPLDEALIAAFQKKHPNVEIKGTYDPDNMTRTNGPKIISASDTPDIAAITDVPSAAKGHHVTSLETYSKAYGWKLPSFQTTLYRQSKNGEFGTGDLYAMPVGQSFTGVYWNKKLGEKIGMSKAPATLDEFRDALAKAKDSGILPIMINGKDGGASFIFQSLLMSEYGKKDIEKWVLQRDGGTFETADNKAVAKEIQDWVSKGYFPKGVNAIDGTTALGRFGQGEGLFFFQGNWSIIDLAKTINEDAGFFAFPGTKPDSPVVASLNAATSLGIPSNAKNKNAAAAFLDFAISEEGRKAAVEASSYAPSGEGKVPEAKGVLKQRMLEAYSSVLKNGETTNFISNATAGMQQSGLDPNMQLLLDGSLDPSAFVKAVQSEYASELGKD